MNRIITDLAGPTSRVVLEALQPILNAAHLRNDLSWRMSQKATFQTGDMVHRQLRWLFEVG